MNTDQAIEQEIQAKGKTAPRVTPADIESNIIAEYCFTAWEGATVNYWAGVPADATDEQLEAHTDGEPRSDGPLGLLTFCVLILRNGYTVTGESACVSPENFNAAEGRKWAREKAVEKIWPLMGYALKQALADGVPVVEKKPPYTWADVANFAIFDNNVEDCRSFVIQTRGDNRNYQGSLSCSLTQSEFRTAAIRECTRQRDDLTA